MVIAPKVSPTPPDRSKDVDRFNLSTCSNYSTTYNTTGYGCYTPTYSAPKKSGWYDGAGRYHEN